MTSKSLVIAKCLNWVVLALLVASVGGFLYFQNAYGLFLASVTALIAFGVYKNHAIAYFSTAAWGLACYQLAKEGYEFQAIKHHVMTLGFLIIPIALFLHEKLAKKKIKNAHESVTNETNSRNMPQ